MIGIMSGGLDQLFRGSVLRQIDAGASLFHSGDPVQFMYLVATGRIDLLRATGTGVPIILQRSSPGQVLAEASAYSARYHCEARAKDFAMVRAVPVSQFRDRLGQDVRLAELWAAHLAHTVQSARLRAEIRTLRTVAERLDVWLEEGHPLPEKGGWQDLAGELGVSREALYRELAKRR